MNSYDAPEPYAEPPWTRFAKLVLLGRPLTVCRLKQVAPLLVECAKQGLSCKVAHANVHMLMEAYDSAPFAVALDQFDLLLPDGRPLVWWLRAQTHGEDAGQIRGMDLLNALCANAALQGVRIGIYGGNSVQQTQQVCRLLSQRYQGLSIVYAKTPPFGEQPAMADVAAEIRQHQVQLLFVALGCPKQEQWIASNTLACVQVGIGAAMDFLTGDKRQAPRLLQKVGFEWCWRLLTEPKRLWRRYLKQNPRFIYLVLRQWWRRGRYTQ